MATDPFRKLKANSERAKLAMLTGKKEQLEAAIHVLSILRKPEEADVATQTLADAIEEVEKEIAEITNRDLSLDLSWFFIAKDKDINSHIAMCNATSFKGFDDWRLPTKIEVDEMAANGKYQLIVRG